LSFSCVHIGGKGAEGRGWRYLALSVPNQDAGFVKRFEIVLEKVAAQCMGNRVSYLL